MPTQADRPLRGRVPLTAGGIGTGIVGALTVAGGLTFGLAEVAGLGITMLTLLGVAVTMAATWRPKLRCERWPTSTRSMAGQALTVSVSVTHAGTGHSPTMSAEDTIVYPDGRRSTARQQIPPLAAGKADVATYTLHVPSRGICTLGPMRIIRTDPFGLARKTIAGPDPIRITVLPRIEAIAAPHFPVDTDTHASAATSILPGSEFASLRDYIPGDDPRRVHWRSSAHRDDLVVRHDEQTRRSGCTILLDVRPESDYLAFERAVSAAASILAAANRDGQTTRLMTTAGFDSSRGSGGRHLDLVLGELAVVQRRSGDVSIRSARDERVIIVTSAGEAPTLGRSRTPALVVTFTPEATRPPGSEVPLTGPVVSVGPSEDFVTVWNRSTATHRIGSRHPMQAVS